jgi:uncharacterized membrane protein
VNEQSQIESPAFEQSLSPADQKRLVEAKHAARRQLAIALVATLILSLTLPEKLVFGPRYLTAGLEVLLLGVLGLTATLRGPDAFHKQRVVSVILISVVNIANLLSLILLLNNLLHGRESNADLLIFQSAQIWLTNVIGFALWYWEMDRGGPVRRVGPNPPDPDFLFPQLTAPDYTPVKWSPSFIDYLYVSFTNSTAFSPTDTLPLTPWVKMLMMVQAITSLLTVALVAARAVNILK